MSEDEIKKEEAEIKDEPVKDEPVSDDIETDDDVIEFEFYDDGEADLKVTLKKIRKDLKEAQKEKAEYLTSWQKERADFQNYKKDEDKRRVDYVNYARERFALELLPVLDSYDMAFQNKEAWEKVDKNWRIGVEYIHQQLLKILVENGVDEIQSKEGDQFDLNLHQSVESVPTEDQSKDHTISKILNKGYKIGNRVLRPSRVNVFAYKE